MFGTFYTNFIPDQVLCLFKFFWSKLAERRNGQFLLQIAKRIRTFLTSDIVFRSDKAVLYFTVCNDDLGVLKKNGCIFILQSVCVKKYCVVFFPDSYCKLIHNSTVTAVKIIFGVLSE